jgi:hypothetical protein
MDLGESSFCLIESNNKGRCVCAVKPIEANSIILKESPLVLALYNPSRKLFCAYCTDRLDVEGIIIYLLFYFFFRFICM